MKFLIAAYALSDTSFFIYHQNGIQAYFLVYVDDLLITGSSPTFLNQFSQLLSKKFSLKDLRDLHYFLGLEVIPTAGGLFLTQHKDIHEIFESTGMAGAKEVYTPNSVLNFLILPRLI